MRLAADGFPVLWMPSSKARVTSVCPGCSSVRPDQGQPGASRVGAVVFAPVADDLQFTEGRPGDPPGIVVVDRGVVSGPIQIHPHGKALAPVAIEHELIVEEGGLADVRIAAPLMIPSRIP